MYETLDEGTCEFGCCAEPKASEIEAILRPREEDIEAQVAALLVAIRTGDPSIFYARA